MAHRILIIDDSADIRWMLSDLLESQGYQCEKAPNAITALTMVQKGGFDLILTDYQMPRMNGIELLRSLTTMPEASIIPKVMITATASDELAAEARQAGACAVLKKPVNFDELLLTVERMIKRAGSRKSDPCHCL